MKAMVLNAISNLRQNHEPLSLSEWPRPTPKAKEILIKVSACGVCHTELDEIEGRTPPPRLPVILGHQAVGRVIEKGNRVRTLGIGDRVGVAWIFSACGHCDFCQAGKENLCQRFKATGRDANGGYAEYMTVPAAFAYVLPDTFSDVQAAPLLCAGAIGYRSLCLTGIQDGQRLGLTGFGASAHLVLKMVKKQFPGMEVYVFARSPNERGFALEIGAKWSGAIEEDAPLKLHAVIDTTPAWKPVVHALQNLMGGGRLVINAIRKESRDQKFLLNLDYSMHLWMEKEIKSVANVTRRDVAEFIGLAAKIPILPEVQTYPLEEANQALMELKQRRIRGAKVLVF
jgi:propanol-preferring alcohol dehydrogenase